MMRATSHDRATGLHLYFAAAAATSRCYRCSVQTWGDEDRAWVECDYTVGSVEPRVQDAALAYAHEWAERGRRVRVLGHAGEVLAEIDGAVPVPF
jgi:hypothetical protein